MVELSRMAVRASQLGRAAILDWPTLVLALGGRGFVIAIPGESDLVGPLGGHHRMGHPSISISRKD